LVAHLDSTDDRISHRLEQVLHFEAAATVSDVVDPVVDRLLNVLEVVAERALAVLDNVNGLVGRPVDVVCALVVDADGDVVGAWVGGLCFRKPFRGFAVEYSLSLPWDTGRVLEHPAKNRFSRPPCASTL